MKKKMLALTLFVFVIFSTILSSYTISSSALSSASAKAASSTTTKLKVALILPGSISDASWNASGYKGLLLLKKRSDISKTAYVQNVSTAQTESALRTYAQGGYNLIITFGSGYGDIIKKVAKDYPKITFASTDYTDDGKNTVNFGQPLNQSSYLVGVLGAYLTKTKKIGFIMGMSSDVADSAIKAYTQGAKSVNSKIQVISSYVGSWSDVEKGKQTAIAQAESGVDYILASGDSVGLGIIEGAKEKNIFVVGDGTDQNSLAPKNVVTSTIWNAGVDFNALVTDILKGTVKKGAYSLDLKDGAISLSSYHGLVSAGIAAKVRIVENKIKSGKIVVK